jgi:hypothetical protein
MPSPAATGFAALVRSGRDPRRIASAGFQAVGLDDVTVGDLSVTEVAAALHGRGLTCSEVGILRAGEVPDRGSRPPPGRARTGHRRDVLHCDRRRSSASPSARSPRDCRGRTRGRRRPAGARVRRYARSPPCECDRPLRCGGLGALRAPDRQLACARGDAAWDALESLTGEQIALVHLNDALPEVGSDRSSTAGFAASLQAQESSIWRASST